MFVQGEYFAECEWCSESTCYEPQWCAKSQKPTSDGKVFEGGAVGSMPASDDFAYWVPQDNFKIMRIFEFSLEALSFVKILLVSKPMKDNICM